jgi:hypothetical protein
MNRVQKGQFRYEKYEVLNLDKIAKTKAIKAYFMAPALHPLIDKALVELLNEGSVPEAEFHYLRFPAGGGTPIIPVF